MADWPQAWFLLKHDKTIANETSNCTYNVTLRRAGVTNVAVEEPISITYSLCVSAALVIQHVKRMCRIILSYIACLALPDFSGTIFGKINLLNTTSVT